MALRLDDLAPNLSAATTERRMAPILVPNDGGKKVNILGIPMVIRIRGRDTGGVLSAVESHDVPAGGPPPHIHSREDETFQVLEGEYDFNVGGKSFVAGKGTTIFAPRGIPHTYRYLGQAPGRLMCVITPAGFEGFFEAVGVLAPEQQQDIPRVIAIAKQFGLEILPPSPPRRSSRRASLLRLLRASTGGSFWGGRRTFSWPTTLPTWPGPFRKRPRPYG